MYPSSFPSIPRWGCIEQVFGVCDPGGADVEREKRHHCHLGGILGHHRSLDALSLTELGLCRSEDSKIVRSDAGCLRGDSDVANMTYHLIHAKFLPADIEVLDEKTGRVTCRVHVNASLHNETRLTGVPYMRKMFRSVACSLADGSMAADLFVALSRACNRLSSSQNEAFFRPELQHCIPCQLRTTVWTAFLSIASRRRNCRS